MCGIAGARGPGALRDTEDALALLAHRGPGDRRVDARGGAAVGLARLHVTAARAPSGPYVTADGRVAAAVNGEIWNHDEIRRDLESRGVAVRPGADTAVVAPLFAADGIAGLAKLRGMFAAAIVDARDGTIVLARDRFGVKPLHYAPGPPLRWASEASALRSHGGLDADALADFLALGFVPAPRTLDADVRQVPPGTALAFRGDDRTAHEFAPRPVVGGGPSASVDELRAALDGAVRRHLMGDLPIAVLVSGGLDSALVAAAAADAAREAGRAPPSLVALTFPGEGTYDEAPAARAVAAHLRIPLVESALAPGDVPHILDAVVRAHGGPFGDASALATHRLCVTARDHAGVVLSGTGADELCSGYRRYRLGRLPAAARVAARAAAAILPGSRRTRLGTLGALARKAARADGGDDAERYLESLAVIPVSWRARLLGRGASPPALARLRASFRPGRDFADAARDADAAVYLPDDLLAKEDRAAAAVALENRVPYLDDELAALALRAPASSHLRAGGLRGAKASLRAVAKDRLPDPVRNRPKQGFGVPISEWMRGPLRDLVDSHLADPRSAGRACVDPSAVAALVAAHRAGDDDLGPAVWALVVLEAALRRGGSR